MKLLLLLTILFIGCSEKKNKPTYVISGSDTIIVGGQIGYNGTDVSKCPSVEGYNTDTAFFLTFISGKIHDTIYIDTCLLKLKKITLK